MYRCRTIGPLHRQKLLSSAKVQTIMDYQIYFAYLIDKIEANYINRLALSKLWYSSQELVAR